MNKIYQLMQWIQQGHLKAKNLPQALEVTHAVASPAQQFIFWQRFLLIGGAFTFISSVIFFFAFNWDDLGRLFKLALVQFLFVLSLAPLLKFNAAHPVGQLALGTAALMLGACLALIGQTYQTGADTYELFLYWAVLLTPWLILSQQVFIAFLVWLLSNLALYLYHWHFSGLFFVFDILATTYTWQALSLNLVFLIVLETYAKFDNKFGLPSLISAIFIYTAFLATDFALYNISFTSFIVWLSILSPSFYFYRYKKLNVLHLSVILLSAIFYLNFYLAVKIFNDYLGAGFISLIFFITCFFAGRYLKNIYQLSNPPKNVATPNANLVEGHKHD